MVDYDPQALAQKWTQPLSVWRERCEKGWLAGRPTRRWFDFGRLPESDAREDGQTPLRDLRALHFDGRVVFAHFARAFFPAYVPGRNTHYGSVVYAEAAEEAQEVFELAARVNALRTGTAPPPGAEQVAAAINDDSSEFARIDLPAALGVGQGRYFANICIQRTRLPSGYLHSRLVPILIRPEATRWCCLLPLRFWDPEFASVWRSGPPSYPTTRFWNAAAGTASRPDAGWRRFLRGSRGFRARAWRGPPGGTCRRGS